MSTLKGLEYSALDNSIRGRESVKHGSVFAARAGAHGEQVHSDGAVHSGKFAIGLRRRRKYVALESSITLDS